MWVVHCFFKLVLPQYCELPPDIEADNTCFYYGDKEMDKEAVAT